METTNSSQTRLLYNPQLQSAEMTEKLFVVRQEQFALLLNNILKEKDNSIPQHYLIIGQRGMGKTTILKRMEVELHKEQYRKQFIPLLYREEQYNVKDLAEFWLNTLDALADSLQSEDYPAELLANIDKMIQELSRKTPDIVSKEAYKFLMDTCHDLHRRPVLLIDNIDIVFSGLDSGDKNKKEQWALRKLLSENGAPIIIGGGITTTDDVAKYNKPFYDFFKIQYLKKLNYEEFVKLLNNLATVTNSDASIFTTIQQNTSRQKALLELTGGSPRVTVMLFDQISKGFSTDINDDLNILADAVTPLYKAKFEELPQQLRTILDAIALNWDAISLRKLAIATRLKNNQLSPQLKRLVDDGWIETTPAYKDKGNAYFISERFFNIYYLIRNSSRRHKDKIYCLSKFLECFYGKDELEQISGTLLKQDICSSDQMLVYVALMNTKVVKKQLRDKIAEKAFNTFMENEKLGKEFDFPYEKFAPVANEDKNSGEFNFSFNNKKEENTFKQGIKLHGEKKYEKSIKKFDEGIALNKQQEVFWTYKGMALLNLGHYEEALTCFDEAIKLKPEIEPLWWLKGNILIELEHYTDALICFDKVLKLNPDFEPAWFFKGKALKELERNEEAIICFEESIRLNPENEYAWYEKGDSYKELQQNELAVADISKAIEINSNNAQWYCERGCLYVNLQNHELAIADFTKVIELNINDQWNYFAYSLRESAYCIQNKFELAIDDCNKAIDITSIKYSRKEMNYYLRGCAKNELSDYSGALEDFDKSIDLDPNDKNVWFWKAECLFELKRYTEAINAYDKATELDSNYQVAWSNEGYTYMEMKDYDKAVFAYEKSRAINPQDLMPKFYLMFLYRDKLKEKKKAIEIFESIKEEDVNQNEEKKFACRYYLHKTLFELYEQNKGIAKENLLRAFEVLEGEQKLSFIVNEEWWSRISSVVIDLDYGSWLLEIMKEKGYDVVLSPYYTAIQALEIEKQNKEDAEIYLNNRAVEISETAREIIEKIRKYMD
ncbi:hypothetical protein AGMMS49525_10950 [Bacteroidia bacterium]|nr:hypothetical protein AGMMS49525_10950 [Bacteroidia bacterium]